MLVGVGVFVALLFIGFSSFSNPADIAKFGSSNIGKHAFDAGASDFSVLLSSIRLTNSIPMDSMSSIPIHRWGFEAIAKRHSPNAKTDMEKQLTDASKRLEEQLEIL